MNITYSNKKDFSERQVEDLFVSVEWLSGNYPEKLFKALQNSQTVITAWDNDKLVGLSNALDDGELTAFVCYLLVHPDYQKCGIGRELIGQMKEKYADYLHLILIAEKPHLVEYYENLGFKKAEGTTVMGIETL